MMYLKSIDDWKQEGVLSVLGTTASGKTSTVLSYLRKIARTDILLVNVDSVSAYRHLDIGSAKVRGKDRSDFQWCGIDSFEVTEKIDAASFKEQVFPLISKALKVGQPVLLVGGSHFYERFLVEGASPGASSCPVFQETLEQRTSEEIARQIVERDPRFVEKIHLSDRYRLGRLADLVLRQGLGFQELFLDPKKDSLVTCTHRYIHSKEKHVSRIHERVDEMFDEGWIEEVERLIEEFGTQVPALESVGYKEIRDMLTHTRSKEETVELIKIRHAQLAKKQRTWLRKLDSH